MEIRTMEQRLRKDAIGFATDISRFRATVSQCAWRPYEGISATDRWSPETTSSAEAVISQGWRHKRFPPVKLDPPLAWDEVCASDRSWSYHLHCWDALSPVLSEYDHARDPRLLEFSTSVALDWARQFPSIETPFSLAWYDMAIGMRSYRVAYMLDAAARVSSIKSETIRDLLALLMLHAEVLQDDRRFASHSNHGFYFAAGQAALAARFPFLPGMTKAADQARLRLETLIQSQFTSEGVHREHSPDYHRMVFETFDGLLRAGIFKGESFLEMSDRIQEALAWFVMPNGRIVMFGDSPHRMMVQKRYDYVSNGSLRFAVSGGKTGRPPKTTVGAFPESGYIVFRSLSEPQGFANCSFLAQTCAFHSRVHKHADDLSFVWFDWGQELLTDSGRFGYRGRIDPDSDLARKGFWYSDPHRVYVESTRAHNTVEIDGESYPRAGVKPYGSALVRWGEEFGVHFAESRVLHWGTIQHKRLLLFRPAEWLVVVDMLSDHNDREHDYVQRFQVAPELFLLPDATGLRFHLAGTDRILQVSSFLPAEPLPPARGQTDPHLLGWVSREDGQMTPCWAFGFTRPRARQATFATLFTTGGSAPKTLNGESFVDMAKSESVLRWEHEDRRHCLQTRWPNEGPFCLDYKARETHVTSHNRPST